MAEDPGSSKDRIGHVEDVSQYLDLLKKAPSDYTKTIIVREKLVPCVQKKGTTERIGWTGRLQSNISHFVFFCFSVDQTNDF